MSKTYRLTPAILHFCWACGRNFLARRCTAYLCSPRCRQFASRRKARGLPFRGQLDQVHADDVLPPRG
jgi:hypothetical protein